MIEISEYIDCQGKSSFSIWFESLNSQTANKVHTYLTRVQQGNTSNLKPIKGSLYEIRIDWGGGYRIYCGKDGETLIILLAGGTKKRQQKDIDQAVMLWQEYKMRKKEV